MDCTITWKVTVCRPGMHGFMYRDLKITAWTAAAAEELAREQVSHLWRITRTVKIAGSYEPH